MKSMKKILQAHGLQNFFTLCFQPAELMMARDNSGTI